MTKNSLRNVCCLTISLSAITWFGPAKLFSLDKNVANASENAVSQKNFERKKTKHSKKKKEYSLRDKKGKDHPIDTSPRILRREFVPGGKIDNSGIRAEKSRIRLKELIDKRLAQKKTGKVHLLQQTSKELRVSESEEYSVVKTVTNELVSEEYAEYFNDLGTGNATSTNIEIYRRDGAKQGEFDCPGCTPFALANDGKNIAMFVGGKSLYVFKSDGTKKKLADVEGAFAAFSPDGSLLALLDINALRVFETAEGKLKWSKPAPPETGTYASTTLIVPDSGEFVDLQFLSDLTVRVGK